MSDAISVVDALDRFVFSHAFLTTFSFDHDFFEEFCVDSLKGFKNNGNITILVDGRINDALLENAADMPQKANLRYLLHPIRTSGIFHAKVFLFANAERARLIIGSCNLTRSGISSNAEMLNVFDVQFGKDEELLPILQEAVEFIARLLSQNPGSTAESNYNSMLRECPSLARDDESPVQSSGCVQFVHNLDTAMLDQVAAMVKAKSVRPDAIQGVSRFFDAHPGVATALQEAFPGCGLAIHTQNGVTNLTEAWVEHAAKSRGAIELFTGQFHDDGHYRPLHAKLLIVRSRTESLVLSGSANLTTPGLLRPAKSGNIETGILWIGKLSATAAVELCDPTKTAKKITSASDLRRVEEEEDEGVHAQAPDFFIAEAFLRNEDVVVDLSADIRLAGAMIILTFRDGRVEEYPAGSESIGRATAPVGGGTLERLHQESAVVMLKTQGQTSNRLLLQNLQDLKTGGSLRKLRSVLDAQKSARMFTSALAEILASEDHSALLHFLNYCDIPLSDDARKLNLRLARQQPCGGEAFAPAKARNLAFISEVFPAAQSFIEKHHKRLRRHIESPGIRGVPNFMHITIAILQVIRSQIENIVYMVEHPAVPGYQLDPWEWGNVRTHLDAYLRYARDVAMTAGLEYIPALEAGYEKKLILAKLEPERDEIVGFKSFFSDIQRRVFACSVFPGKNPRMPTFGSVSGKDYLKPEHWPAFSGSIQRGLAALSAQITAA